MHALRQHPLLLCGRLLPQAAAVRGVPAVAVRVRHLLPQAAALHPGSLPAKLPRRLLPKTTSATLLARDWGLLPLNAESDKIECGSPSSVAIRTDPYRRRFLPVETDGRKR